MSCQDQWTIRFPFTGVFDYSPLEIRPRSLNLQINRKEFDFARAEFDPKVGDTIKPHTRSDDGLLRTPQPAKLYQDGYLVSTMYFKPDFVEYTPNATYIELEDMLKSLDNDTIDLNVEGNRAIDVYRKAFDQRSQTDVIDSIQFTDPVSVEEQHFERFDPNSSFQTRAPEIRNSTAILLHTYDVDFTRVSPLKAILQLNKMTGLNAWVDRWGTLWIGNREAIPGRHIAAPDDERVWRYNTDGFSIRHPREPIQTVVVVGGWKDESGIGGVDDAAAMMNPWDGSDAKDFKAHGIAYRPDVRNGKTKVVEQNGARRESLEYNAEGLMRELIKEAHSGSVEINIDHSGELTNLASAKPGNILHIVPDDHHIDFDEQNYGLQVSGPGVGGVDDSLESFGEVGEMPGNIEPCNSFIHNEEYLIKSVSHNVTDDGDWTMTLDVGILPQTPIQTTTRFYDPHENNYVDNSEVYGNDWVEEGALGSVSMLTLNDDLADMTYDGIGNALGFGDVYNPSDLYDDSTEEGEEWLNEIADLL
jgi:hypothetical protein